MTSVEIGGWFSSWAGDALGEVWLAGAAFFLRFRPGPVSRRTSAADPLARALARFFEVTRGAEADWSRLAEGFTAGLEEAGVTGGAAVYVPEKGRYRLRFFRGGNAASFPAELGDGEGAGEGKEVLPLSVWGEELGRVVLAERPRDERLRRGVELLAGHLALAWAARRYREEKEQVSERLRDWERRWREREEGVREQVFAFVERVGIVGRSPALAKVLSLVERVAPTDVSVLVTGETGTGKELVARAIHELGRRAAGPLVSVNCPAIPGELAESELFGHERGAFTGAVESRPGKFELADGGTLFLDEVGDLPLAIQAKLLRVLQEGEVQRVGARKPRRVDVRLVAATNRELREEVVRGRFREDLFYRLAAVEIRVPPLRARGDDILVLATHFLDEAARRHGREVRGFRPDAVRLLRQWSWPGNVRELRNVVERAVLLSRDPTIGPEHLPELVSSPDRRTSFGETIRDEKKRRLLEALEASGGNQAAAARLLGMSRSNFSRMMRTLGLRGAARERAEKD
ncbi:MAG: hypothetical protein KatS3mg076_2808 [Candidatus Binatia bacterium]|nr:MAG: hypothetical protein KatS3mg076_2808 [Candidatus Binatia bacterium]